MSKVFTTNFFAAAIVLLLPALHAGAQTRDDAQRAAKDLFERYQLLLAQYDSRVRELYTDDAQVTTVRRYADGTVKTHQMQGQSWKAFITATMPLARLKGSRNDWQLRQIIVSADGRSIDVLADRISPDKCYRDPDYRMALQLQADGRWLIREELSHTQDYSSCDKRSGS